jgi:hypothetical protein
MKNKTQNSNEYWTIPLGTILMQISVGVYWLLLNAKDTLLSSIGGPTDPFLGRTCLGDAILHPDLARQLGRIKFLMYPIKAKLYDKISFVLSPNMSEASWQDYLFLGFNIDKILGAVKCKYVATILGSFIFGPCISRTHTE